MLQMIQGFWMSRAIYVAAKLGIADLLKDGPKSPQELAQATGSHAPSLYRVLRALQSVGVFAEDDRENHYPAWEKVLNSVKTGTIAFNHVYGASKWQYMTEHPDEATIFDEAMASFSAVVAAAIVEASATAFSKFMDLNMLVMTGGRERTEAEYQALFTAAGLRLNRVIPTHTEMSILEAIRA